LKTISVAFVLALIFFTACKKSDSSPSPLPTKPTISTTAITNITATSASSGGFIGDSGTTYHMAGRGIVYSSVDTDPNLTLGNTFQTFDFVNTSNYWGSYPSSMTGLTPNTTYYLRAYIAYEVIATRSTTFLYGELRSFKTP
jgi:hypothetical protein